MNYNNYSLVASWLVPVPLSQATMLISGELVAHYESSLILVYSHTGMQAHRVVVGNLPN